jgi:hypothetical protein
MDFWQDILELRGRIERSRASGEFHDLYGDDVTCCLRHRSRWWRHRDRAIQRLRCPVVIR